MRLPLCLSPGHKLRSSCAAVCFSLQIPLNPLCEAGFERACARMESNGHT